MKLYLKEVRIVKSNKTLFYPFDYHSYPLIHYLNKTRNDIVVAAMQVVA